jgi:hypothetical protein
MDPKKHPAWKDKQNKNVYANNMLGKFKPRATVTKNTIFKQTKKTAGKQ